MPAAAPRTSNITPALETAELELLRALLKVYAIVRFSGLLLSVERQSKILANSNRERLEQEGWVL